jgi:hypothetical protein
MMLNFGFFKGPIAQRALPAKATATASLGFSRDLTMMQPQRANTITTYAPYDNIRTLFEGLWSVLDSRDSSESHGSLENEAESVRRIQRNVSGSFSLALDRCVENVANRMRSLIMLQIEFVLVEFVLLECILLLTGDRQVGGTTEK